MKPLVTVITATYNLLDSQREAYFSQCVESVHDQTYENIEHIVIDGASGDGSLELIGKYEELGWLKCHSDKDTGIYNAFNKGIDLANGKYIVFLNSDDFWHSKTAIEDSVKALEKSQADFSYAPCRLLREDGQLEMFYPRIFKVFSHMPFCHQTMLAKKEVLLELGKFDEKYRNASDYDLILKLFIKKYKPIHVNEVFTTFRLGGTSTQAQQTTRDECVKIFCDLYGSFYKITEKEAVEMFDKGVVPLGLQVALLNYVRPEQLPRHFYKLLKCALLGAIKGNA